MHSNPQRISHLSLKYGHGEKKPQTEHMESPQKPDSINPTKVDKNSSLMGPEPPPIDAREESFAKHLRMAQQGSSVLVNTAWAGLKYWQDGFQPRKPWSPAFSSRLHLKELWKSQLKGSPLSEAYCLTSPFPHQPLTHSKNKLTNQPSQNQLTN